MSDQTHSTPAKKPSGYQRKHPLRTWYIYLADDVQTVCATSLDAALRLAAIDEAATPIFAVLDAAVLAQYQAESPLVALILRNRAASPPEEIPA